jgi:hypothetical protein
MPNRAITTEMVYNLGLAGYEKAWGTEHTSTLDAVHNLGVLYARRGHHKDAEMMYNLVLTSYEKVWGHEHMSTLTIVIIKASANVRRCDQGASAQGIAEFEQLFPVSDLILVVAECQLTFSFMLQSTWIMIVQESQKLCKSLADLSRLV